MSGKQKVKNLSLDVRAGEIVGIAGVDGNGQSELLQGLCGLLPVESGEILLDTGCAVSAVDAAEAANIRFRTLGLPGKCRGVEFTGRNGKTCRFTANFGDSALAGLEPGTARLDILK